MEALTSLKEKIKLLIGLVNQLKKENEELRNEQELLFVKNEELAIENTKSVENYALLLSQLQSLEDMFAKEDVQLKELFQERIEAKTAVEDLLKSIDILEEQEVR